jgi:hypothetical protein
LFILWNPSYIEKMFGKLVAFLLVFVDHYQAIQILI